MNGRRNNTHRHGMSQCGVTAIELLIGVAVLTIVALLAIPTSSILIERHHLKSASSNLVDGIYLAKREAEVRASTVRVCPSDDGRSCRADGDWSQGWLVYSDGNADGVVRDIEVIEAFEAPGGHLRIVASGAAHNAAAFNSAGLVRDNGSASGEFILCAGDSRAGSRVIFIQSDGWVTMDSAGDRACETG
jgi:type IV fimbrial biogenesis protein FimT